MTTEIAKAYEPQKVEDKWSRFWIENKLFCSNRDDSKKSFTIVIPPPNVTGSLHMGHALNNTLQDAIIRFRKMQGYNTLWVPGTDHGGIATQNVVEKLLKSKGKSRHDLGRDKFLEAMWEWRKESGDTILRQLERLGCSLDWDRTRFTMDEDCSRAVISAFVHLYNKGLIYRGKRLVNWCPRCNTALADIEVEHEEELGKLWHIQYPVKGTGEFVVVATTRPETMLGDTAVAVNPEDERYKKFVGKTLILPLVNREIPVVADPAVDPAFGTGAVKVTPAHDPTDFDMGMRHKLAQLVVIDFKGCMTDIAGEYAGLDRYAARKKILLDLEQKGLLLETADHHHSIGHCYRCNTVIEPLVSEQWFLKVEEMSKKAMKVVEDGKIVFYPESWKKPYLLWLENLKDWCISRQIWWGHRIPVYYCKRERGTKDEGRKDCPPIVSESRPEKCPHCGGMDIEQDPDVLDTWFSSALWPFSVFKWPEGQGQGSGGKGQRTENKTNSDLKYYYPTSVLATGHEILYLWVARMVQMGIEFMGDIPFREVFIHGIVRDKFGKKMSKSLGNVIDPLEIMAKYGTDALRFSMTQSAAPGRDMQLSEDSFVSARNFANKLWNASRFVFMNVDTVEWDNTAAEKRQLELADHWILSEYAKLVRQVTESLESYNMDNACRLLYDFFWSKYCDWYIEIAKIRLNGADIEKKKAALSVLIEILGGVVKLLHPVMPFITEELWQVLKDLTGFEGVGSNLVLTKWPQADMSKIDQKAIDDMVFIQGIITAVRTVRSEMSVPPGKLIDISINNIKVVGRKELIEKYGDYIKSLAKIQNITLGENLEKPKQSASAVVFDIEIIIPLAGLIDFEKEKQRLQKEILNAEGEIARCGKNLENKNFVERAPKQEVERLRTRLKEAEVKKENLEKSLKALEV